MRDFVIQSSPQHSGAGRRAGSKALGEQKAAESVKTGLVVGGAQITAA